MVAASSATTKATIVLIAIRSAQVVLYPCDLTSRQYSSVAWRDASRCLVGTVELFRKRCAFVLPRILWCNPLQHKQLYRSRIEQYQRHLASSILLQGLYESSDAITARISTKCVSYRLSVGIIFGAGDSLRVASTTVYLYLLK